MFPGSFWFCDTCVLINSYMSQNKFFPVPLGEAMQCLEVTQSRWVIGLSRGPFPAPTVPPSPFISQECVRCKEGVWVPLIVLHTEVSLPSVLERWGKKTPWTPPCESMLGERNPNIIEGLPPPSSPGLQSQCSSRCHNPGSY